MQHDGEPRSSWWRSPTGLILIGFIAVSLYFLITEHTQHFFAALPFLIFLLCPLMMLFMHGGHGGDHSGHSGEPGRQSGEPR
ncbi:MAG: DUF2933 domain-containing protein [Chloroflexota bacterium]|nr:DUF2933 domain-containing protein [Chloroflexota bacterium]